MFPQLETDRLLLREIRSDDAEALFACFSSEEVTRFYGMETMDGLLQAENLIELFSRRYEEKVGIRWGIERKGEAGLIGTIGFNSWNPKNKRAEIGYELHPEHWRKGYVSEALAKVLSYGFEALDLNRIGAVVFPENEASNRLLHKAGFEKEGLLREYMCQNGIAHDTNSYSILKKSFIEAQARQNGEAVPAAN
ncbi:GNAT family N-acetyltransferase [Bacillus sp. B-jedd]|uniref:GNAT family N-acetyltransferase n=1 Tax=Bacillus sp. B-jedd TaxID=1476857 RepID=UPI0005156410|nr:GNAT family protein [Bacillus sp. B-jedd]CEG26163.1 N-acetyltransferase [Bacillus sp. B-jedd]